MDFPKLLAFKFLCFLSCGCGLTQVSSFQLKQDLKIGNREIVLVDYGSQGKMGDIKKQTVPPENDLGFLQVVLKKKAHRSFHTFAPTNYLIIIGDDTINIRENEIILNSRGGQFVIPITEKEREDIFGECKKILKD